jgi:hypothetical protein
MYTSLSGIIAFPGISESIANDAVGPQGGAPIDEWNLRSSKTAGPLNLILYQPFDAP